MATEASSPESENKERNKDDERRRVALVLLFLLLSFICIFCSSQGALYFIDRGQIVGHMRSALQADYRLGVPVIFPRVDLERIIPEIIGDASDLLETPEPLIGFIPDLPQPIAQITPTPTLIPPTPTLTPTSTPTPTPIPPTSSPSDTPQPAPPPTSSPEPTLPPPSPTPLPPSPTLPPPSPTPLPPTPTSPPPPPPTSPPSSPPPTATPLPPPTPTPIPNNPPVAVDDTAVTDEDVATSPPIDVLANDSDNDGTLVPSSVTVISGPANGTTSVNTTTGEITYTPNLNFNGTDTFTYQVCDNDGGCDTATVTITVNPVNDPPTAVDDIGVTNQDTPTTINVAANDSDVDGNLDPTSVITVTNPLSGTALVGPGAGEITYVPNYGIFGVDTFSYQICDTGLPILCDTAMVTVTIIDTVPAPPTNLRAAPGDMQISLGWDHTPEPDLVGYRLYRSVGGGPFSFLTTTPVITKYFDISLTNGVTYAYTVTAIDATSHESGPSNIASAVPGAIITNTTSVTCGGITFTNCIDAAGPPDNVSAAISDTGTITFDFGIGQGIIDGPSYDMVFYELWRAGVPGIRLDFTRIEISTDGVTWFTVFEWNGDNPGDIMGTNIDSFAIDANGEQEDEPIAESSLYPGGPGSHGITIDIGVWAPAGNTYRFVRFTDPGGCVPSPPLLTCADKYVDVDALERLN